MRIHPLSVRITHWTNAVAMTVMIAQRLADLQCLATVSLRVSRRG